MGARHQPQSAVAARFDDEAVVVLVRLRSALAELLAGIPRDVAKAADLQRALKVDMKLSWRAFKVATAADPLAAGHHVPGPQSMKKLLKAAGRCGVPKPRIDAVARAASEFEQLVATHAGDRASFDSMVSAHAGAESEPIDLMHRRAAFRANSHIWGVQAKTHLRCMIIQPAEDPNRVDIATLGGLLKLRQLRGDAPMIVSLTGGADDAGAAYGAPAREPLDPECAQQSGIGLVCEFCSKPLPTFRALEAQGGYILGELVGSGVGNAGALTCIEGHVARGAVPRYRDEHNRYGHPAVRVYVPCETLVFDLLVHEGTFGRITPAVKAYGEHLSTMLCSGPPGPPRERDRLPCDSAVVYLGKGPSVLHTPRVPKYASMARYCFERLGWDAGAFDVYRYRIDYPIMPSTMLIEFELPEVP